VIRESRELLIILITMGGVNWKGRKAANWRVAIGHCRSSDMWQLV
jgi:hypothetical protein